MQTVPGLIITARLLEHTVKRLAAALTVLAALITAAPAHADQQAFLNYIHSQGVPPIYYGAPGADWSNIHAAQMICDVFHNGGTEADIPFLGFQQDQYRAAIIDGARRFMC